MSWSWPGNRHHQLRHKSRLLAFRKSRLLAYVKQSVMRFRKSYWLLTKGSLCERTMEVWKMKSVLELF